MSKQKYIKLITYTVVSLFIILFVFNKGFTEAFLTLIFPQVKNVIHPRLVITTMFIQHIKLVSYATLLAVILGVSIGVFVTRESGSQYKELVEAIISIMQTFPPAAVLALSVPALGYGFAPAFTALFIYSIFPIVSNTVTGINSVDQHVVEASSAIGMSKLQVLFKVELPLAFDIIIAGIRTTTIINVGTATIAAVVSGGGLGSLIISGLIDNNISYIFTGAILTAVLALSFDTLFTLIEKTRKKILQK